MSQTTLWTVFPARTEAVKAYPNAWGSAPPLWELLCQRYLRLAMWPRSEGPEQRRLWDLAFDPAVPDHLRIAHSMTLTGVYLPLADLPAAADACERVHCDVLAHGRWTWSHWSAIGADLRAIAGRLPEGAVGVGLGANSISDSWSDWTGKPEALSAIAYARPRAA